MARIPTGANGTEDLHRVTLVDVDQLLLDPENPRLASTVEPTDQDAILKVLWTEMAVDELVYSIAANGYFREEPLFVVPDQYEQEASERPAYVVVEGNRRLAAVKILLDDGLRERLRATNLPRLPDEKKPALRLLPVSIYGNRNELWTYLSFRHINSPKAWDSYSKARYVAQVHDDLGIPLHEIAVRIGDRHSTVERLYRGYKVLAQAERDTDFDIEDRTRSKFYFSHLYTALDFPEFQAFLGIDSADFQPQIPVPRDHVGDLKDLMQWLYGKKSQGIEPIVVRQNPDLGRLRDVVCKPESLEELRSGYSLEIAYNTSVGDQVRFGQSLVRARQELKQASSTLTTGYDGDESLFRVGEDIKDLAGALHREMKRVSGQAQRRRPA